MSSPSSIYIKETEIYWILFLQSTHSVELWSKIFCSLMPLQENGCNITDIEKEKTVPFEDNDNPHQSLPWEFN